MSRPRRRPVEAPPLVSCPRCRLGLEAGKNPDGLVWHECRPRGAATRESVEQLLLERVLQVAESTEDPSGLAVLLKAFAEYTGGGKNARGAREEGGAGADELEFLGRAVAR